MKNQITSDTLFFAFNKDHGPMSGNSVRKTKKMIEEELKVKFELRDCRRAFGQYCLNNGVPVLMGHSSTKTTEGYYCRKREEDAIKAVNNKW